MSLPNQLLRGLRVTLVLWALTVVVVTLPMLAVARVLAPQAAQGSLLFRGERVVGSRLIGQAFSSPRYLHGRPAGEPNLAPSNPALVQRVADAARYWELAGVAQPAPELLQDSGSGVDPHISLDAARQQFPRLARERQMSVASLEQLLPEAQEGPLRLQTIEPVVNVLRFNLLLDQRSMS